MKDKKNNYAESRLEKKIFHYCVLHHHYYLITDHDDDDDGMRKRGNEKLIAIFFLAVPNVLHQNHRSSIYRILII